jgi:hypothetical protein
VKTDIKNYKLKLCLCILTFFLLISCSTQTSSPTTAVDESEKVAGEPITVSFETSSVYFTRAELMTQADLIFAGKVLDISPTRWNQDSGEYWTETTEDGVSADGEKLTTTYSAWPVYEIRMAVDQPIVDKVGVGQEVVLTLLGKSPIDDDVLNSNGESVQIDAESVALQNGQELIVFASQEELAWRDASRPIELITGSDGTSYVDLGKRSIITLMGVETNAYLVKGSDSLYYPAAGATNKQEPISLEQLAQEITQKRENLASP